MGNNFDSNGGEQNIAQGNHAIGSQTNNHGPVISTTGDQSPAVNAQTVTISYGVPLERYEQIKTDLDVTDALLASFFKILEQGSIPREEWGAKLPEIAFRHKELLLRFESVTSDDSQVKALKKQAGQAIDNGDYDRADTLLNQIDERHNNAIHQLHKLQAETAARLEKEHLGKAENLVSRAKLQRLQYRYEKSAQYFQEAAAALPEGRKAERADYLGAAGEALNRIARYTEALRLCEQGLSIERELGDRKQECKLLNNISTICYNQGEYSKALDYLEQSLLICQELGDKEGEGAILHNISAFCIAKRRYPQALKYLEQSLLLRREMHDKKGEGAALNSIGQIHKQQGDYAAALEYYKQALTISREIKDKEGESKYLNNIGLVCKTQGNYDAALEQYEQSLVIKRQIGDRRGEGLGLNNIAAIYHAKGDYSAAMKHYEQALVIAKEIGDKAGEATYSWNIGLLYKKQGELAKAEPYLSRAVELEEQLEHPDLENDRKALELVRATLRGQR